MPVHEAVEQLQLVPDNPFSSRMSGYGIVQEDKLVTVHPVNHPLRQFHLEAYNLIEQHLARKDFPCIGAKAVLANNQFAVAAYRDMTSLETAEGVCHDLVRFYDDFKLDRVHEAALPEVFKSLIAVFQSPVITLPEDASFCFHTLLRNMHEIDRSKGFAWAERVSNDPDSSNFDYTIANKRVVPVMLHSTALNPDRIAPVTMIAFNPRAIFETLKSRSLQHQDVAGDKKTLLDSYRSVSRKRQQNPDKDKNDAIYGEGSSYQLGLNLPHDPHIREQDREIRDRILGPCPFSHK